MPRQRRLDLARLDAEAADLHLRVGAPEEVQHPVRAPARQVAGAVHPVAGRPKRIRHEPLRRQPRAPQVTARQTRPRDVKLAHDTGRNGIQTIIQDVGARVPDRTANGRNDRATQRFAHGRADRRFGGAVGVDHAPALRPARDHIGRACIAGDDQGLERQVLGQAGQQHRRKGRVGDVLLADQARQRITAALGSRQDEGRTRYQYGCDLRDRRIEARRGELKDASFRSDREAVDLRCRQIGDATMGDADTFRRTGGARRVDDVGGMLRLQETCRDGRGLSHDRGPVGIEAHGTCAVDG